METESEEEDAAPSAEAEAESGGGGGFEEDANVRHMHNSDDGTALRPRPPSHIPFLQSPRLP